MSKIRSSSFRTLKGVVSIFILFVILFSLFPASLADDEFNLLPIPYFPEGDSRPTISIYIDGLNESYPNVILNANDPKGANVTFYGTAQAKDKAANPVMGYCTYDHSTIPLWKKENSLLGNNTSITCYAEDQESIPKNDTFLVILKDITAPVIEVRSPLYISAPLKPGAFLTLLNYSINVIDKDDTTSSIKQSCNPPPGLRLIYVQPRSVTVECSASDRAHNTSKIFTVGVENVTLPMLSAINAHLKSVDQAVSKINDTMSEIDKRTTGIGTNLSRATQELATIDKRTTGIGTNLSIDIYTLDKKIQTLSGDIKNLNESLLNQVFKINKTLSTDIKHTLALVQEGRVSTPTVILLLDILVAMLIAAIVIAFLEYILSLSQSGSTTRQKRES